MTAPPAGAPAPAATRSRQPPQPIPSGQPGRPGRFRRLGLLATRDFRLLWAGETTSSLGSSIGGVALPLAC